jgi:hypothetical protein
MAMAMCVGDRDKSQLGYMLEWRRCGSLSWIRSRCSGLSWMDEKEAAVRSN